MPTFIGTVVANIALGLGAGAGTALTIASFAANYGLILGGLALSSNAQKNAKRKAREQYNAAQVDRIANVSSTVAPRELVLGRLRKGGSVFYRASTGSNKATFVMLVALAGHEIDAVEQIYLNDQAVTLDGNGNVQEAPYLITSSLTASVTANSSGIATLGHTPVAGSVYAYTGTQSGPDGDIVNVNAAVSGVTVTTSPNATVVYQYANNGSHANIRAVLGSDSQAADSALITLLPSAWTAAHRARGVAYLVCTFQYSETAFPNGLPVVSAVIRGAKVYDPRTTTTAWSQNPALLLRHVYQHPSFGKSAVSAEEDARIITAANACETSTGYVVGGVTDTQQLYRAALAVPFGAAARDVMDDLAQAMGGSWAFAGGQLYLRAGVWTAPVLALADADLAVVERNGASESQRPISISVHKERAQKFNSVNVTIWDAADQLRPGYPRRRHAGPGRHLQRHWLRPPGPACCWGDDARRARPAHRGAALQNQSLSGRGV
jgi:hypothetical protein